MQIVMVPTLFSALGLSLGQVACVFGVYTIGLYGLGARCSYLVQTYRRNRVCINSLLGVILSLGAIWLLSETSKRLPVDLYFALRLGASLSLGVFYGLAQLVLMSTLVIDVCESFKRTEANYAAGWFSRIALSLGPVMCVVAGMLGGVHVSELAAIALAVGALVLVSLVSFPFKAPDDQVPKISLDRFLLPQGFALFFNQIAILLVVGMLLAGNFNLAFYGMVFVGLLLAIVSERLVFANADLKSEIVTGHFVIIIALLLLLLKGQDTSVRVIVPVLIGLGVGIIGARFQLFFIKLSNHCQRGTSQSSFFLSWESGLFGGLSLGYFLLEFHPTALLKGAILLSVVSLICYHFYTHTWYVKNKNR